MRIDLPTCNLKTCRHWFDGNCTDRNAYNRCEYALMVYGTEFVPVVRCGECKWWFTDKNYDGLYRCANVGLCTRANWFCADGEKKEQNDG